MQDLTENPNLAALRVSISEDALDQLFREARTHSAWLPEPVLTELLRHAYELARLGPTSANGSPGRFVFVTTPEAKARLLPALAAGNRGKYRENEDSTSHGYHRLRSRILREIAQAVSASRSTLLVRKESGAD